MVDEISRQLPVVQNSVSPPFWGRALLNAVSEVGEGELVLRFSNGAERTIRAAKSGASAVLNIARARTLRDRFERDAFVRGVLVHAQGQPAQHRGALRSRQYVLFAMARSDNDLFVGIV